MKQIAFRWLSIAIMFAVAGNASAAESCAVVFPGAVQSHHELGDITIRKDASILGQLDTSLTALAINPAKINNHCAGAACIASGSLSSAIDITQFIEPLNGDAVSIDYLQEQVLGLSWINEFSDVDVGPSATLTFSADHNSYLISRLTLGYGSTLNLAPGDYWIGQLKIGANSTINIVGDGVVRLFVNKALTVSHGAIINDTAEVDSVDSQKLFLFTNKKISLASHVVFNGLIYSRNDVHLGYSSRLNGAIAANDVRLGFGSTIEFNPLAVSRTEFIDVCAWGTQVNDLDGDGIPDELDPDRDGDGISNYYESLVGTNPDDVSDVPADTNLNGVPDSMELGSGANQCVSAFATGLQSHAADSKLTFAHDAQLLNVASPYLPFTVVKTHNGSNLLSCDTANCIATGLSVEKLDAGEFKSTTSAIKHIVNFEELSELDGSVTEYKRIQVKSSATLMLRNTSPYRIKKLSVGWSAKLQLEPGEYWIEDLNLGSQSTLEVVGEGTVRLFIKDLMHAGWYSQVNVNSVTAGSNANKLLVYAYDRVFQASNSVFEGHIFSVNRVKLDYASQLYGAIAANKVKLSANAKVNYLPEAINNIDFGFICDIDNDGIYDGFDADRDGDGINNDYEVQVGTDPDNAASVPLDSDHDGIPDLIDDDRDGDGVNNDLDAFPDDASESSDIDNDGIGDNTDPDRDGDGISNDYETQLGTDPNDATSTPPDLDADHIPDSLDDDIDGDGYTNAVDIFPNDATEWTDLDSDGIGDNSDLDRDGDGISNDYETQLGTDPNNPASVPADFDGDGIPDVLDSDRDGDGVLNDQDVFPDNPAEWSDIDGDGIGDNSDPDRDGDGISNDYEIQAGTDPNNATSTPPDLDTDGIPDSLDDDRDGDGHNNDVDKFPDDATEWADLDNDGIGDNADTDRDGDGISNDYETQLGTDPNDATSTPPDLDTDGIPDSLDDDRDGDGVVNTTDVFPDDATETADLDGDGIGDNSDPDRDGDGISNDYETQLGTDPNNAASTPPDLDNDGIPDSLDDDRDGDGVLNTTDVFPDDATESTDLDNDGIGDNTDPDRDGDGISNDYETQLGTDPNNAASTPPDLDTDGIPDSLDDDRDGDGVLNTTDVFPDDATESTDLDNDGIGDNADTDRDGDGISNDYETQAGTDPNNAASTPPDLDTDGIPDSLDDDRDGDGVLNTTDVFPDDATESTDLDNDGIGDNADTDRDGDGISNDYETQAGTDPNDATSTPPDLDNDGIPDSLDDDRDGDGVENITDAFPDDATETADLDGDGTGDNTDIDIDGDGVDNALDAFPLDPTETADLDGDGTGDNSDTDIDGDGVANDQDALPNDPTETTDLDGDGIGDNSDPDRDGDGISNVYETQVGTDPNDASSTPADLDSDGIPDSLDNDRDGDGVNNDQDSYPDDATRSQLPAVANLQAALQGSEVSVQWSALTGEPVAAYNLYRNTTADSTWIKLNAAPLTVTGYTDSNISAGVGYRYHVIAQDGNANAGAISTEIELFAAFNNSTITGFAVTLQAGNGQLDWQAVTGMQYRIYRGLNGATPSLLTTTGTNQYIDNTIAGQVSVSYQVATLATFTNSFTNQAVDAIGPLSQVLTIVPLSPLEVSLNNVVIAGDGVAELAAGLGGRVRVTGQYNNAAGEVTVTASTVIDNETLSVSQISSSGQFDLELPATQLLTWQITVSENTIQDRQVSGQVRVLPDTIAPVLSIDGGSVQNINAEQMVLSGDISDVGSGIQSIVLQSDRYAGINFDALMTDQRFNAELPLQVGVNILTVTATDVQGNSTQATVTVNREIAAAPRIEITSPLTGSTTTSDTVDINGIIYSSQASDVLRLEFAGQQVFPTALTEPGLHGFSFTGIHLQTGVNVLSVRVDSPLGSDVAQVQITYEQASNQQSAAPSITVYTPSAGSVSNDNVVIIQGTASSSRGIASILVNGVQVSTGGAADTTLGFEYSLDMVSLGEGEMIVPIVATDTNNETTTIEHRFSKDTVAPLISLTDSNLLAAPEVNTVRSNPYSLTGHITDNHIAGFTINGQAVDLLPGIAAGEYIFDARLLLPSQTDKTLSLVAWDQAGQQAEQSLVLLADVAVGIDIVSPVDNSEVLVQGTSITVDVTARLTGWLDSYRVTLAHEQDIAEVMSVTDGTATHQLPIPTTEGLHQLTIRVEDGTGQLLSEASRRLKLVSAEQIPLQVVKTSPAKEDSGAEPHAPISLYFNRPIDRSKLQLHVHETFSGLTYDLAALEGKSSLENQQVELSQVDRSHQAVTGGLSFFPENTLVSFYPEREFAYGATVYVDVVYDGQALSQLSYRIRELPTFLQGTVVASNHVPLQGITVAIPKLNRETQTSANGNYGFGFGDPASNTLPAGRYKMVFNPGLQDRRYATLERWVTIEKGRLKKLPINQLQVLSENAPFNRIQSGVQASLFDGELMLDLSNAQLYFPDGRREGDVHVQLIDQGKLPYDSLPGAMPHWLYAIQPMDIKVTGSVQLDMAMPSLYGKDDYIPADGTLVVLLGYHSGAQRMMPVGVGAIQNKHVISQQPVPLDELSYLGYALVQPQQQSLLQQFIDGSLTLDGLISGLSQ